jgi:hypothetical protein
MKKYVEILCTLLILISLTIYIKFAIQKYNENRKTEAYIRAHKTASTTSSLSGLSHVIQLVAEISREKVPDDIQGIIRWIKIHDLNKHDRLNWQLANSKDDRDTYYDRWDNPIQFVVNTTRNCSLISYGPNGKNDNGKADDIVISFDPYELIRLMQYIYRDPNNTNNISGVKNFSESPAR